MFRIAMFMVLLTACSGKDDAKDVGDSDSQVTAVDDDGDGFTDDIEPRPAFHHTQLAEPVAACLRLILEKQAQESGPGGLRRVL